MDSVYHHSVYQDRSSSASSYSMRQAWRVGWPNRSRVYGTFAGTVDWLAAPTLLERSIFPHASGLWSRPDPGNDPSTYRAALDCGR